MRRKPLSDPLVLDSLLAHFISFADVREPAASVTAPKKTTPKPCSVPIPDKLSAKVFKVITYRPIRATTSSNRRPPPNSPIWRPPARQTFASTSRQTGRSARRRNLSHSRTSLSKNAAKKERKRKLEASASSSTSGRTPPSTPSRTVSQPQQDYRYAPLGVQHSHATPAIPPGPRTFTAKQQPLPQPTSKRQILKRMMKEERKEERNRRKATTVASRPAALAAADPVALAAALAALSPMSLLVQQQQPSAALGPAPVVDLRGISQQTDSSSAGFPVSSPPTRTDMSTSHDAAAPAETSADELLAVSGLRAASCDVGRSTRTERDASSRGILFASSGHLWWPLDF